MSLPGKMDPVFSCIRCLDYEYWVAEQLSEFLTITYRTPLPADFQLREVLRWWFDQFNFTKRREVRKQLGVTYVNGANWTENGQKPSLRKLLHLCHLFGVSLMDFLQCRIGARHPGTLAEPIPGEEGHLREFTPVHRRIDHKAIRKQLDEIVSRNQYPLKNFRELCKEQLNLRPSQVYKSHREQAKALGARFLKTKSMLALQKRESFIAEIRVTARYLWERGITPHHKSMAPYCSKPSNLRCIWAMAALKTFRKELGIATTSQKKPTKKSKYARA